MKSKIMSIFMMLVMVLAVVPHAVLASEPLIPEVKELHLRVMDELGNNVDNARVSIRQGQETVARRATDDEGHVSFHLNYGRYVVEVVKQGYESYAFTTILDDSSPESVWERVILRFEGVSPSTANLEVTLLDENGAGFEGQEVLVYDFVDETLTGGRVVGEGVSDSEGRVRFGNLREGTHLVEVQAENYRNVVERIILVGDENNRLRINLEPLAEIVSDARLEVRVVGSEEGYLSQPLPDSIVLLYDVDDNAVGRTTTNDRGDAHFSRLKEGLYKIEVHKSGYMATTTRVRLTEAEVKRKVITLEKVEESTFVNANLNERINLPIKGTAVYREEGLRITFERFYEDSCGQETQVREEVLCFFDDSREEQTCYSDQGHRCTGVGSCNLVVSGTKGDIISWRSSCGDTQRTRLDGTPKRIRFNCGELSEPEFVREQVTCIFSGGSGSEVCFSDNADRCSGSNHCSTMVTGHQGDVLTWKSSCSGVRRTVMDGENKRIIFDCERPVFEKDDLARSPEQEVERASERTRVIPDSDNDRRIVEVQEVDEYGPEDIIVIDTSRVVCANKGAFFIEGANVRDTHVLVEEGNSIRVGEYVLSLHRVSETQSLIYVSKGQEIIPPLVEEDLLVCPRGCREVGEGCLCPRVSVERVDDYYELFSSEGEAIRTSSIKIMPGSADMVARVQDLEIDVPARNLAEDGLRFGVVREGVERDIKIFVDEAQLKTYVTEGSRTAETRLVLTTERDGIATEVNQLRKAINILPEEASEIAEEALRTNIDRIEIREKNGEAVYEAEGKTRMRILGIIPVNANTRATINVESGALETKMPWYSFISTKR